MRFGWPHSRPQPREPVTDIESRLSKAMGDHAVSAQGEGFLRRVANADQGQSDQGLERFGRLVWLAFEARRMALSSPARNAVVDPALPILYFGDWDAYLSSQWRIVTVGLNPSEAEFPPENPFKRFPLASALDGPSDEYLAGLDTYFNTEPYNAWSSSFEPVLNGLDASYYPGARSTALHTHLCSPVATDPTWSKLDREAREALVSDGVVLWHELVRELRPDVVLVSMARAHLEKIEFEGGESFEISRLEEGRRRPFVTEGRWLDVDGHRSLMVFGPAAQRPFGSVSDLHKIGIGGRIATRLAGAGRSGGGDLGAGPPRWVSQRPDGGIADHA